MRANLSFSGSSWFYKLDYKKLILIAFLARFICASAYDVYSTVTHEDPILPDGAFYSVRGWYIATLLNGYREGNLTEDILPSGKKDRDFFMQTLKAEQGRFPSFKTEDNIFCYIVGGIYFLFGYFPFAVRVFNICLSICGAYFLFSIARRHFGGVTANVFLLVALFLPTHFIYSVTLAKDFLRMFLLSFVLWRVYG